MSILNKNPDVTANGMAHSMSDKAQSITKSIENAAHNFSSDVEKAAHEVSEKTASYVKSTRGYIKENPVQSVVVAAATGLALGSLATMFSRRS